MDIPAVQPDDSHRSVRGDERPPLAAKSAEAHEEHVDRPLVGGETMPEHGWHHDDRSSWRLMPPSRGFYEKRPLQGGDDIHLLVDEEGLGRPVPVAEAVPHATECQEFHAHMPRISRRCRLSFIRRTNLEFDFQHIFTALLTAFRSSLLQNGFER